MAKKKKNYNLILYELQQEAIRSGNTNISNRDLEIQAEEEYLAPIKNVNPAKEYSTSTSNKTSSSTSSKTNSNSKRTWFNGGAFSDGYQFGDITRTITGTATDLTEDIAKGILGIGEGILDTGAYLLGAGAEKFSDITKKKSGTVDSTYLLGRKAAKASEDLKDFVKRDLVEESGLGSVIASNLPTGIMNNLLNGSGLEAFDLDKQLKGANIEENSLLGEKSDSLVQSGGQLLGTIGLQGVGVPWFVTTGVTSFGGGTEQAFNEDATYGQAGTYGLISAGAEVLTEKLSGGISFGGKTLDAGLKDSLTKGISNKVLKTLVNFGFDAFGEGAEEVITEVIQNVGQKLTYEDEKTWNELLLSEDAMDQYLESFIGGAVLGGVANTGKTLSEIKNQTQIDGLQQEIAKETEELNKVQDAREKQIRQEKINGLNEELAGLTNAQTITNESELRKQNFTYEANENDSDIKKAVYESASQVMNNTEKSHKFVEVVAKIAEEKGTAYKFTNNEQLKQLGYAKEGMTVNGLVNKNGEVLINIDSAKALNTVVGHETTHLLEGTKEYEALKQIAIEYSKTKGDYDTRIEKLTKLYEGTNADIEAELTSDIVGEYLFTDENFVRELSVKQPTVFEKIKNFISDLIVKFKGTDQEKQLRQLQRSFEKAYKAQGTQTTDTKYSMNEKAVQGLENYSRDEIKQKVTDYINTELEIYDNYSYGLGKEAEIVGLEIIGSRNRGNAKKRSDLDIVVEFKGDSLREDSLFNALNDYKRQLKIDGIRVDINPIVSHESGTLAEYMESSNAYDKEILSKQSTTDNQGRTLSKEQQEYFKDSKIRDENGNLLTVYHGTNADFNVFKKGKKGYLGPGIYLAEELSQAERYTDYGMVKEVYVDIKNPLTVTSNVPDKEILNAIYGSDNVYNRRVAKDGLSNFLVNSKDLKKLQEMGYDGIAWKYPSGNEYMVLNSNQIKNVDNTNPTSNPDIRYSLSEDTDIDAKINSSMTMEEAREMVQRAFNTQKDFVEYETADEWLKADPFEVGMIIENTESLIYKYINSNPDIVNEEYTIDDVLDAYMNGTLVGKQKAETKRLDLSKDTSFKDSRFYAPQDIEGGIELYEKANQRVTKSNRQEIYKARANFIINAHNKGYIESLGLTQQEVNKKLKSWADYPAKAMQLSNELNEGVSKQNQWTGIENSSIVNTLAISEEELKSMVKEIKGESSDFQRRYITSAMLALDTHIDYSTLTFEFESNPNKSYLGLYDSYKKTIYISPDYRAGQNTVAHEIGHYIDEIWGKSIFGYTNGLTTLGRSQDLSKLTPEQRQFVENFNNFIIDLESTSDIKSNYTMTPTEVFARFVGKFTEWTKNQATNNRYGYEEKHYKDNFTEKQYKEFAKLLQEKSLLDTTMEQYSLSAPGEEIAPTGNWNVRGEDIKLQVEEAVAPIQEAVNKLTEQISNITPTKEEPTIPLEQTTIDVEPKLKATEQVIPQQEKVAQNGNTDVAESKQRKWVGTSTESEVVNREILPDDLDQSKIFYQPITNKDTLNTANEKLDSLGYEKAVEYFNNQFLNKKTSVEDIALGERLIQEAIKNKDTKTAGDLIQNIAILGTELGQKVQALSIIQRMTPEGQLKMLEKTINRGKTKGDKAFTDVELTQEMKEKILKTYNDDGSYNQEELNKVVDEVKQEIADQMPTTLLDKVNAWRYFSMLGNPKTHIRNLVSNVAMKGTTAVKNAVARTIEGIAPIENRTRTWKAASEDVTAYAKQTALEMKDVISGDSKYSEATDIKAKRETFKNKVLEKLTSFNSDLLEKEDWWFSKGAFESSFREFLTANGIETKQDVENNPELIEKGKQYAVEQAQIATFRQYSWLANKIRDIESKNTATSIAVGAILPFKKTPINIAKTGLSYSPLGFAKTLTYDVSQVKKGNMEASTLIDHIAQNTTGTALTLVGYMLAQSGFLNGAGDDDKEGKYDYQLGKQAYSINIGGNTYSLSWLSPVAMPLFVGANAYEQLVEGEEWNADVVLETLGQTLDPLSEMSFLSSLDSVLSSYDSGVQRFFGIGEAMAQNYITQFVPTLSSQVAATFDDTKRSTKVSGDSTMKVLEETYNKLIYKIPGLRETLEPSTDIWGNEIKQNEDLFARAFESFIAPYSRKESIATEIDEELKDLFSQTGDNGLIPSIPYNYVNFDGEKYNMSAKEYTDYKKTYGQTANDLLEDLFRTTTYQNATSEERADMVNDVYDYARDEAKLEYLGKEGVDYTNATEEGVEYYKENLIKEAIKHDMTVDEYKLYDEKPDKYNFFKENGISYNAYTENKDLYNYAYEHQERYIASKAITDDFATYYSYVETINDFDAKDEYGNSVNGLKKERVINYVNSLDLSIAQKALLIKQQYKSFDDYNNEVIQVINELDIPYEKKVSILKSLDFTVDSEGWVYWD